MAYTPGGSIDTGCSLESLIAVYFKRLGFNEVLFSPGNQTATLCHPEKSFIIGDATYKPGEFAVVDVTDLTVGKILPKVL